MPMTATEWDFVKGHLPERWRVVAIRQGWPDALFGDGIAFNNSRESWLCRSPVFIRDRTHSWYFFRFSGEVSCFRIHDPLDAQVEFVGCSPPSDFERFKVAVSEAFEVYGFYGLFDSQKISTVPKIYSVKLQNWQAANYSEEREK